MLHNAACIVNDLIHEEMERQSAMRSQYYTNPLSFSIDNEFKYINQLLLEFIDSISQQLSVSENILHYERKVKPAST